MNFSVPNPCNENWNSMPAQESGRYCGSCSKVVVDFTNKTNEEILDYIKANIGSTCGTFKSSQLPPSDPYKQNERSIRFLAAVLLAFGLTLFSCGSIDLGDKETEELITTGIVIEPPREVVGVIVCNRSSTSVTSDINVTTGEVGLPNEGDTIKVRKRKDALNFADQMPEFGNGENTISKYIANNLTYPRIAIDSSVQGVVYITFVIQTDGKVVDATVLKGTSPECDFEALRVVKNMPPWKPGKDKGVVVNVRMTLPIKFRLK